MTPKGTTYCRCESETNEVNAGFTNGPELLVEGFKIVHFGAEVERALSDGREGAAG